MDLTKTEPKQKSLEEQRLSALWNINNNLVRIDRMISVIGFSIATELFAIVLVLAFRG